MKEGQRKIVEYILEHRACDICGEPATSKLSFLLENARNNPASKGYRRDDTSWSSDENRFSCETHKDTTRQEPPEGMSWCSTFSEERFPQMFLDWQSKSETFPE